jgi:hypothetical protein
MIDFIGIGAQKAGTTWIYEHLCRHPQIRFPAEKEVHFWDIHRARGEEWWIAQFPETESHILQGEITPAYAILDREPIGRIRTLVPDARLFYIIRNPIERAWSAARMALARAEMLPDEASDSWFLDHFNSSGSMRRGSYVACVDNWLAEFPSEQLAVIFFDDIVSDPRGTLCRLCEHLGADPAPFEAAEAATLSVRVFESPLASIRPALLDALRLIYADEIHRVASRFGRDLSDWWKWDGTHA